MKDIDAYVVRTGAGFSDGLRDAFVSRDDAIEYIAEQIRESSGRYPEVKLEKVCGISVPDGWTRGRAPRRVYVLLEYVHEGSEGAILGFHTTCDKARKAMELRSRHFLEEGWYLLPRLEIAAIDLHTYTES